jgi:hypothetical protein
MRLAEKCADTFSHLKRNLQSKNYYLKQVKNIYFQQKKKLNKFDLVKTCTRIKFR